MFLQAMRGDDVSVSQVLAVLLGVIGAVTVEPARTLSRPAAFAADHRQLVDQRRSAGCCRAGCRRSTSRPADAVAFGDQVML